MEEIRRLGNVYDDKYGTNYAGNVWDSNGLSPTILTAQGGGRQPMIVNVKQATKQGFIPCEVGGGGRSELPRQYHTERKSSGQRKSVSNSDNGEYP